MADNPYYWKTHTNAYHLMHSFILNPIMMFKNITPMHFRKKSLFENLRREIRKSFVGKNYQKILSHNISILSDVSQTWVINRSFSKKRHDSLLTTKSGFWEFKKPTCVNFWRRSWWSWEKFTTIRFCIHETKWRLKRYCASKMHEFPHGTILPGNK